MKKRQFKASANSGRLENGFGGFGGATFGSTQSSKLSYVQEPLDYSLVSNPNLVVAFKNLSKKDSTTKAKALEDIHVATSTDGNDLEDAIVEIWVTVFPRLSIDSARRVRQLAHDLNGQICAKHGKRIARYLPRISGPWLAGTFDVDRAVARAAQEALFNVFPTPEKISGFNKAFQGPILEHCRDTILTETVQSLSDERSVNREDAEATYARVISSSVAAINSMLENLPADEVSKQSHVYETILSDGKCWDLVVSTDASVRRAVHRFVRTSMHKQSPTVEGNLEAVSKAYVYKGLPSDQTGSAVEFVQTLDALTTDYPQIWTEAYSSKKSAITRLQKGLEQGSHSSSTVFWSHMTNVILHLSDSVLPKSRDEISELLSAARNGVARREERFNASAAWPAYFTLVNKVTASLLDEDCETLLEGYAMPAIKQYLFPSDQSTSWNVGGAKPSVIVSKVTLVKRLPPLLEREWPDLADKLVEIARISQPEQSKDFDKSQKHVASCGERWADLQRDLLATGSELPSSTRAVFITTNTKILHECISLLRARNGKPYGAAAMIEEQLRACGVDLMTAADFRSALIQFVHDTIPKLLFSPSQRHLPHCVYAFTEDPQFPAMFQNILQGIMSANESDDLKVGALRTLLPSSTPRVAVELVQSSYALQGLLVDLASENSGPGIDALVVNLLNLGALSQQTTEEILSHMTTSLSLTGPALHSSLSSLQQLITTCQPAIHAYMATSSGKELMPSIVRLEQSPDDTVAEKATVLSSRLSSATGKVAVDAKYSIILQNLQDVSSSSLPMDALLDLADKVMEGEEAPSFKGMIPSVEDFRESITAVMSPPKHCLSLLSPLGGAVHFVQPSEVIQQHYTRYDAQGLSQGLRTAIYLTKMLNRPTMIEVLETDLAVILVLLKICVSLAEDIVSVPGANGLVLSGHYNLLDLEVLDFISEANSALRRYWQGATSSSAGIQQASMLAAVEELRTQSLQNSSMAYYSSVTYANMYENLFELHGYTKERTISSEETLKARREAKDPLGLISFIIGFARPLSGSQALIRLYNERVATLTDIDIESDQVTTLHGLVVINAIMNTQDEIVSNVPKTRLIFFMKRVIAWLDFDISLTLKAEICKALNFLMTHVSDIYGEHWSQIVSFLEQFWNSASQIISNTIFDESGLPLIHASLRLYRTLYNLTQIAEPNDDLAEALQEKQDGLVGGLITLLKSSGAVSDEDNQALAITNEQLARDLLKVPPKATGDAGELYPLMCAPSHAVQDAALNLLHKKIAVAQEQISFDAALDDKIAHLPDELLSLLIDAPTLDSLADASFNRRMPLSLQGFLYSWRLVFDHFNGSSYRVKSDYAEQLKDGGYLSGLLDLAFGFLGHTRGKPIDASKFDFREYLPAIEPSPEKDVQWLLTHLYYLALAETPNLVKSFFLEIRSRQTSQAVESWTAKYISPVLIDASLRSVSDWAEKSAKDDPEYQNITIKVGMRSKEISVSYLVDEQTMGIKVVLPETYPLDSAKVVSVNRVAVNEEKWQSWLRNTQGVIRFSNGSITDGLSAWRKNVTGTLKGQSECAICYSIINAEKQLPTKRCPTCKNLFHSACLFKWFKTSNASTCPLCRNPFNFN